MNQQILLKQVPEGTPEADDFELVEKPLPSLAEGEVLCKTSYLSLDPYMRSQISGRHISGAVGVGDLMLGEVVAQVIESKHADFQAGELVRGFCGWQAYANMSGSALSKITHSHESYALSILGMPGLTAYAGLMWQAQIKPADVVVIPAAIGGVGATAGQLAKQLGCTVIGISSSEEKCRFATEELGYDHCINRNQDNISEKLKELCPEGIDVYFDLVGGELLHTVSRQLAVGARVILCGLIAETNSSERSKGPEPAFWIKARAIVYGLVVYDFEGRRQEFIDACMPMVESGELKMKEDISEGLASAPQAFANLMQGKNVGKALVKV